MSRVPEKGKPDFTNLDIAKVKQYKDVVNDMIQAFSDFPEEKEVLTRVWKYLNDECTDRIGEESEKKLVVAAARPLRRNLKIHSRFESKKIGT